MTAKVERAIDAYEVQLANAAAYLYGCTAIFWKSGKHGFAFVGRPDNTDAAEQTHLWLITQVDKLYKLHLTPGMTQRDRAEFRRTFKVACACRVAARAAELVRNPLMIAADIKSTALVVGDYFKQLKAENAIVLQEIGTRKSRARGLRSGSGTEAGLRAGDQVQLRRELH